MSGEYVLAEHEGKKVIKKDGQILDLNEIVGVIRVYRDVYFWVVWKNYPATATTVSVELVLGSLMNEAYPAEVIHFYESATIVRFQEGEEEEEEEEEPEKWTL